MVASLINKVRDAKIRNAPISNAASKKDPNIYSDDEEDTGVLPTIPSKSNSSKYSVYSTLTGWMVNALKAIVYVICLPFVLCCDLFHSGFTFATSLLTRFNATKRWKDVKDIYSIHVEQRIPVLQNSKRSKILKLGLFLLISLLIISFLAIFRANTNPLTELWTSFSVIFSSALTTMWSCCTSFTTGTMGLIDSTYYNVKTTLDSNRQVKSESNGDGHLTKQDDFNIQVETALNSLLNNEKFALRIKEWVNMDDARLKEVISRIEDQEVTLTKLINDHKSQTDDKQIEINRQLEHTKVSSDEKLSMISNGNVASITDQIVSIEQRLKEKHNEEKPIIEKLQSEITDLQEQLKQLRQEQGNHSINISERKSEVLSKLHDFETRLNNIASEQNQLSQTISGCSNTKHVEASISDDNLLKTRISQILSDIFDQNLDDDGNQDSKLSNVKKNIHKLNSLVSDNQDTLSEEQLREQLTNTFEDWKKDVLNEIQPHMSKSLVAEITKNELLKETIEVELNKILEHRKVSEGQRTLPNTDPTQFSEEDVSRIVKTELVTYDADKTGKFDFALESAGGTIVSTRCTQTYDAATAVYSIWGVPIWWESVNGPRAILQPGANPGQCWAVKGDGTGFSAPPISVVIELSDRINIDSVTLEHIPETLSPDGNIKSAPKLFSVLGLSDINDPNPVVLGNFTYVIGNRPVQTFKITNSEDINKAANKSFSLVELKVHSNYGNPIYTCIYRFRVHGNLTPEAKTSFR